MVKEWTLKPLGELVDLKYGKALKAQDRPEDGLFPVYGSNGIVGTAGNALVNYPTIVIGRKGAVGEAHLAVHGCWPIDTTFYTRPRPGSNLNLRYLLFYIRSIDLRQVAITSTIPGLNRDTLASQKIPVPPLPEQERIVELLDAAGELRRLRAEADRRTADLLPAIFHEMFGDLSNGHGSWPCKPLRDLLSNIDSGWSPKCPDRSTGPDEWGVLKLGAVTSCKYIDTENKVLSEGDQPRPHLEVKPGDLLFTRKNTYDLVAACALVQRTRPKLMLSDLIFRLRIREGVGVIPEYLWAALTNRSVRSQVQRLAGGSAGSMPNISKGRLYGFTITVPPETLQSRFATRLAEVRVLEAQQAASRQRLDDLFQSMLHRAFRGEL